MPFTPPAAASLRHINASATGIPPAIRCPQFIAENGDRLLTTRDAYSSAFGPLAWQIVINNETGLVAISAASAKQHDGTYASVILIDKGSGRFRKFGASAEVDPGYDEIGKCVPNWCGLTPGDSSTERPA